MTRCNFVTGAVCLLLILSLCEIALPDGLLGRFRQRRQQRQQQTYQSPQYCPGGVCNFPTETWTQPPITTYWVEPQTVVQPQTQPQRVEQSAALAPTIDFSERLTVSESRDSFRRSIIKAIQAARKAGAVTPKEALTLRVAMLSPSFRSHAKTLCVVQMASSTKGDLLPRNSDGSIDVEEMDRDWEGFGDFLERFIPLLLQLLQALGVN